MPANSVWVLDFVQGRFHITSPCFLRVRFIKLGPGNKEGLRVEAAGESLGGLLYLSRNVMRKEVSQGGVAVNSLENQRKGGLGDGSGVELG